MLSEAAKSGEITASSSASRVEGAEIAYTVKAGDKKIINVYFKKTADSSALLAKYEIISVAFADSFYKTATITMPQNTEIKVNGIALDSADIKTATLPEIPKKYKPENLKGSSYATLSNLLSDDLTVEASETELLLPLPKAALSIVLTKALMQHLRIHSQPLPLMPLKPIPLICRRILPSAPFKNILQQIQIFTRISEQAL